MSGIDIIRDAHNALRRAVGPKRREAKHVEGPLAKAFREAMAIWDAMKADGMSLSDRCKGLEAVLRQVWPFTREWHTLCPQCNDYGLQMAVCPGDATCGDNPATHRPRRPHLAHDYGRPCYCELGRRFREAPKPGPDDFTQAGKSKSRSFSRMGR